MIVVLRPTLLPLEPALLQHRRIGDPVISPDSRRWQARGHHPLRYGIIGLARSRIAPGRLPAGMPGDGVPGEGKGG